MSGLPSIMDPNIRKFFERCFSQIPPEHHKEMEKELKALILAKMSDNSISTTDWTKVRLPIESRLNSAKLGSKYNGPIHSQPNDSPSIGNTNALKRKSNQQPSSPLKRAPVVAKMEKSFRSEPKPYSALRAPQRPQRSSPGVRSNSGNSSSIQIDKDLIDPEKKAMRERKFGSPSPADSKPRTGTSSNLLYDKNISQEGTIVGRSQELEKDYLRLTSEADPARVRPPEVLEKALYLSLSKWDKEHNYNYLKNQMKAIRQDLTVQGIQDSLTVRVYEAHARISITQGDLSELNQCLTALVGLYKRGIYHHKSHASEFVAYSMFYLLLIKNWAALEAMLSETKLYGENEILNHAQRTITAYQSGFYTLFLEYCSSAPNHGAVILGQVAHKVRLQMTQDICRGLETPGAKVPLDLLGSVLVLHDQKDLKAYLTELLGSPVGRKSKAVNQDSLRAKVDASLEQYVSVDIKGQK